MATTRTRRKLASSQAHLYFYALPVGEHFSHKGERYVKTGEESARSLDGSKPRSGGDWLFEAHYGVLIDQQRAKKLHVPQSAHRPVD
jgi:hypothetical protein